MANMTLRQLIEQAERRVERGKRRIAHQHAIISALDRDNRDTAVARRTLGVLEVTLRTDLDDWHRLKGRLAAASRAK